MSRKWRSSGRGQAGSSARPVSLEVVGLKELTATLRELPNATQRSVLRRVTKQALEPVADQSRSAVPVRTGKLRDSVRVIVGVDDPGYRARAAAAFKKTGSARGVKRTKGGGNIVASVRAGGPGAFHAVFVEFGTVKMPAEPFMRPAFDSEQANMLETIKRLMVVEIRKAADRRAKRLAKRSG